MPSRPSKEIVRARLHEAIDCAILPKKPISDHYIRTYEGILRDFAEASARGWTTERVVEYIDRFYSTYKWMPKRRGPYVDEDAAKELADELNLEKKTPRLIELASVLSRK